MHALGQDVRLAIRLLLKDRRFSIAAIAALTLGIGATNMMFTVIYAALIRPMPFAEAERVVAVEGAWVKDPDGGQQNLSAAELDDLRRASTTFESIGGTWMLPVTLGDDNGTERMMGAFVTADTFRTLGVAPVRGRDFTAADDEPGTGRVALISSRLWHTRFGGQPNVLGRTIRVNAIPTTIVGIMPEGFAFPQISEVWVPAGQLFPGGIPPRDRRNLEAHGKLKPGVTLEQADAELRAISGHIAEQYPETNAERMIVVRPYRDRAASGNVRSTLSALFGATVFVLLIACVNVANLLLARAAHRGREIATRVSLGASRWRIIRQLSIESIIMAAISGVLALWISVAGVRAFALAISTEGTPYWLTFSFDPAVFAFLATTCLTTAVVFGLAPAIFATRGDLARTINEDQKGSTPRQKHRFTAALVAGQLALAVTLVGGTGLMLRTLALVTNVPTGIDTSGLVRMSIAPTGAAYRTAESRRAFYRELEERLANAPGRGLITLASAAPRGGGILRESIGNGGTGADSGIRALQVAVGAAYQSSLGGKLLEGRWFETADRMAPPSVVVINERFARRHFGATSPIGKLVQLKGSSGEIGTEPLRVIGVAANIRQLNGVDPELESGLDFEPVFYIPLEHAPPSEVTVIARSDAAMVVPFVREQLKQIDADVALFEIQSLDDAVNARFRMNRILVTMFGGFALLAIVLAGIGLYGINAYTVGQRAREIAIRMAVGATSGRVAWLLGRRTVLQLAVGALLGIGGAVALGRALQGFLVQVDATDIQALVATVGLLLIIAGAASWAPVHRALTLDPAATLRSE